MSQADLFVVCVSAIVFIVVFALVFCASVVYQANKQIGATRDTLDQLYRLSNDRCMNIVDSHLQAKRDEWDGRNSAPQTARGRTTVVEPEPEADERPDMDWANVSAVGTPNGRA